MSAKNLTVLALALVALAAVAFFTRSTGPAKTAGAPSPGDLVLPGLDVNQARTITIESPTGTNRLSYTNDRWVIASLYDYPADFGRIREQLIGLLDLKVGQVLHADDATQSDAGLGKDAKTVTLRDAGDQPLAAIRIGTTRTSQSSGGGFGGYPDGQYVSVDDDHVVVVAQALQGLSERPEDWISRELLRVDGEQVASIAVDLGNESYGIQIDTNKQMTLEGLGEDETFDTTAANRLKRALSYLSCQEVADPSLSDEVTGLDHPVTYTATLRDGPTYTVSLGATTTNNARYARIAVSGGDLDDAERARLQDWTYLIPTYAAESMTLARESVAKPKETPKEEAPAAAEPAADAPAATETVIEEPGQEDIAAGPSPAEGTAAIAVESAPVRLPPPLPVVTTNTAASAEGVDQKAAAEPAAGP